MKESHEDNLHSPQFTTPGYTLLLVITFAAISFLILGAALDWCMTNGRLTDRNNQYFTTAAAAEAATEKVLSSITHDYAAQGESIVWVNIDNYRKLVPTAAENPRGLTSPSAMPRATRTTPTSAASPPPLPISP